MKSKSYLTFYIILLISFSFVSIQQTQAQDYSVFELKGESNNHGSIASKSAIDDEDETPYQLLYSLKPTIYVKNNSIIKVTGPNNPVSLTTSDVNSLNILKTDNPLFNTVQILKIQLNEISDLNKYLDMSSIQGFDNLSYVYFMCYFKCTESQIRTFIKNARPETIIYFEQVNPS